jgi:Family of unknown function (DUF5946)
MSTCPGCGLELSSSEDAVDARYKASYPCRQLCDELAAYTLTLADKDFIHQLVVDTYCVQHVGDALKPIAISFALIGLFLTFERGYTGRQVQRAHMWLAKKSKVWPRFEAPQTRALITVLAVVQTPPGSARNDMIRNWGKSVWDMWQPEHKSILALMESYA